MNQHRIPTKRTVANRTTSLSVHAIGLALLGAFASAGPAQAAPEKSRWAQGRILVKPKPGMSDAVFALMLNKVGARSVGKIRQFSMHMVNVPPQEEEATVRALQKLGTMEYVELDRLVPISQTADDPYFANEWHLKTINAGTAWDSATGTDIIVAVLDTGVTIDHADLQGQLLPGWNAVDQSNNYADIVGHGTKVAGTVSATTNNGTGVASVAPKAKILPIRVSNDSAGYAYWSDIARGLTWAADHGARVANISYDAMSSSAISNSAKYMNSKGGLVVVSAGNSGTDLGYVDNPYMIAVSATNANDSLTSWSSFGNFIDVAAPGEGIYTTNNAGGYSSVSGTSFSSPVTAGVVALIMSANPALTAAEVESILKSTAVDRGTAGWDNKFGYGRVNAAAAVAKALATTSSAPAVDAEPPGVTLSLAGGTTVSGTQSIGVTATDNVGVTQVDLWIDGKLQSSAALAPYSFSWNTVLVANGSHTLEARAYDAAKNVGSTKITVNVNNVVAVDTIAPSVVITSPSNGATLRYSTQFKIVANDNVAVKQIACYFDTTLVGLLSNVSSGSCNVYVRKYPTGSHTFKAIASDAAGNTSSSAITVKVVR